MRFHFDPPERNCLSDEGVYVACPAWRLSISLNMKMKTMINKVLKDVEITSKALG